MPSFELFDNLEMHARATQLISELGLSPHPEGGYFSEIHRSPHLVQPEQGRSARSAITVIYFLLAAGEVSRWHRVASDETWHFHEGAPLELFVAAPAFDTIEMQRLGPLDGVTQPVRVVRRDHWQAARTSSDYTLVSCAVGPGFDFADFEMLRDVPATAATVTGRHPDFASFV